MSPIVTVAILLTMVATSFLSGVFGMAGGLILIGVLLALMPLPDAMALHAITQMASNGWRGLLWVKHVRWRAVAVYLVGALVAMAVWSFTLWTPSKALALLMLGVTPFLVRLVPESLKPDPLRLAHGAFYGAACMTLMLLTGVAGPLMDSYFLGGSLGRKEIVATKAICQIFGHGAKFLYFGALVEQAGAVDPVIAVLAVAASMAGTSLARPVLERLSDKQYRVWATRIITTIALAYVAQGSWLLFSN